VAETLCEGNIFGDLVRLAQVFSNLLNNASRYSPEGGTIALTAERFEHEAVISVKDNGIGISAAELPHIFEVFIQTDRSRALSHGGLGLGLTLSRRLSNFTEAALQRAVRGQARELKWRCVYRSLSRVRRAGWIRFKRCHAGRKL
jgi:K+-sensing histidine kinase KdpD